MRTVRFPRGKSYKDYLKEAATRSPRTYKHAAYGKPINPDRITVDELPDTE